VKKGGNAESIETIDVGCIFRPFDKENVSSLSEGHFYLQAKYKNSVTGTLFFN